MNTMKRTVILSMAVLFSAAILQSCGKTVSAKKLDGEWDVTEGTIKTASSYTIDDETYSSSSTSTFDGTTLKTTVPDEDGGSVTISSPMTISLTFDKKTGEYTKVTKMTDSEYEVVYYQAYYEKDSGGNYVFSGYYERTTSRVSTETEEGLFTISGDAGDDIEKNSQVVFQMSSSESQYSDTYEYHVSFSDTELDAEGKYRMEGISYVELETSDSGTETTTGSSSTSEVWNVVELKKGEMQIEYSDVSSTTDEDGTESYSAEYSWTLTQK